MTWLIKLATGNPVALLWIAGAIVVAAGAAGASGAWTVQGWRLDAAKAKFATFQAQVKALGDVAVAEAKATELADIERKWRIDNENSKLRIDVAALANRLRDARASGGILPAPAPGAASPDRIAFDRPNLERTLQQLDAGVSAIVAEGDAAVTDLDSARKWAADR